MIGGRDGIFVKICGITSEEDALVAVAMGADSVGFVFAPSARQISPVAVSQIVRRLPSEVMTIGVFKNETPEKVVEIVGACGLAGAQLHGNESTDSTKWIAERIGVTIKAFTAGSDEASRARDYGAYAVMLDSITPGGGELFDWSLAEGIDPGMKMILAGGLTPSNVGEAIASVNPWGVDVSSGVESIPGRKDARKIREFIEQARSQHTTARYS
ncbi:MAG TPA: phosphoribosylanthranilate isomerase [Acidimicrobiales bacterium]|nr:phosphoribosylanthranilate isomerase [Acidimicrobiales bacterium]